MESNKLAKLKKDIVLGRLRQAPPTLRISFGSKGKFLVRDELIKEVNKDTAIGKRIVEMQIAYMKALKKGDF